MPKLLLDEAPLVILPQLAVRIGLNEAIVLQQIHYWLQSAQTHKRANFFKKNRWWVAFSSAEWAEQFPFWSEKTVKRTFTALETQGLIQGEHLSENAWDRTNWYTINYAEYERTLEGTPEGTRENTSGGSPEGVSPDSEPSSESLRESPIESTIDFPTQSLNLCPDAFGQFVPMHQDNLTQSNGTKRPDPFGQSDPTHSDNLTRSLKKEKTSLRLSSETTTQTRRKRSPVGVGENNRSPDTTEDVVVAAGFRSEESGSVSEPFHSELVHKLIQDLIDAGVGRRVAERLAVAFPDEVRRQLDFLPFAPVFTSSRGAYLRKAIEESFGPPSGWEAAQVQQEQQAIQARRNTERQTQAQEEARRIERDRTSLDRLKQTVQEREPEVWQSLLQQAEQSLPPPIRNRPGGPIFRAAIDRKVEELLLHRYPVYSRHPGDH